MDNTLSSKATANGTIAQWSDGEKTYSDNTIAWLEGQWKAHLCVADNIRAMPESFYWVQLDEQNRMSELGGH